MAITDKNLQHLIDYGNTDYVKHYSHHLLAIRKRIQAIGEFIDNASFDGLDWGNVGDVAKVHADLDDICEFLNLK